MDKQDFNKAAMNFCKSIKNMPIEKQWSIQSILTKRQIDNLELMLQKYDEVK